MAEVWREHLAETRPIRSKYVGQVVPTSQLNLAGEDEAFAYNDLVGLDDDDNEFCWRDWRYASVSSDDIAILADSQRAVSRLVEVLEILSPLIKHYGLADKFSHVYDMDSRNCGDYGEGIEREGFCCRHHAHGDTSINISTYISVVSARESVAVLYTIIHELAHLHADDAGVHDKEFRVRFGDYLGWYFAQDNSPLRGELTEYMRGTPRNYYAPFFNDALVDEDDYLYELVEQECLYSRVSDADTVMFVEDYFASEQVA